MSSDITNPRGQHHSVVFCGVDALVQRLSVLAMQTVDQQINNEINAVVAELYLLDNSLYRLRYERSWVDEQDIDMAIDRLRSVQQRGAR